ncbi:hypothetical protein ILYODFUR_020301, partial [Ilyodon furcidens]
MLNITKKEKGRNKGEDQECRTSNSKKLEPSADLFLLFKAQPDSDSFFWFYNMDSTSAE